MDETQFKNLLEKYRLGNATAEERTLLESWYLDQSGKTDTEHDLENLIAANDRLSEKLRQTTGINVNAGTHKRANLWTTISIAASILVVVSIGAYLLIPSKPIQQKTFAAQSDILPGSNKAILTLGSGKQIILTGGASGIIESQGSATITNTTGKLLYQTGSQRSNVQALYNSVSTPRGGEYEVVLPDGSHVWLNAASSITFPTAFIGPERKVKITGEAYFEITHNRKQPFRVVVDDQVVEVLGTHFNIMAYSDEEGIRTTLLEGSVKVTKGNQSKTIKPGQETFVKNDIRVQQADTETAVAWKNGRTYFRDADIPTMMRSLSRWYNIEVVYEGRISTELFTGGVSRKSNLSSLLKILEANNIHSHIDGRKLTITP